MPRLNAGLKNGLCLAVLCITAGCMNSAATTEKSTGMRNQDVELSSLVGFDAARFSGRWHEVESYVPEGASCVIGGVTFSQQTNGDLILTEGPCADGAPRSGVATRVGPGRFSFEGEVLWVLWIDQSYDVAVIATASGKAHILGRKLQIASDKRQAAHDILNWNGFDTSKLRAARRK
jgi:apolipoprotein D and lipocalin family protein